MHIRTAVPTDASSLAALSIEVWLSTYLRNGVSPEFADYVLSEFTAAKFEKLLEDPDQIVYVSANVDGIDGYVRIAEGREPPVAGCSTTEITTLYVRPGHQGRGLGKLLLDTALDHCRAKERDAVWLTTNSGNASAIRFYLAQGFERVGTTHFDIQGQSYLNDVFSYRLS